MSLKTGSVRSLAQIKGIIEIMKMNIQIFGTKKCNDTKKAERFLRSVE